MLTPTDIWRRGWMPLPLTSHGKPGIPWRHLFNHRDPNTWAQERRAGWTQWGVVTGQSSGIIVLDCDTQSSVRRAKARGIPDTFTVETKRGMHFYFKAPSPPPPTFKIWPDADLKAQSGMVVLIAPGKTLLHDRPLADPPRWLIREIEAHARKKEAQARKWERQLSSVSGSPERALRAIHIKIRSLRHAPDGKRNIHLNGVAHDCGQIATNAGIPFETFTPVLIEAALNIGLTQRETERTIKSALGRLDEG